MYVRKNCGLQIWIFNVSINLPEIMGINITTDSGSYEQGAWVEVTTNITNNLPDPLGVTLTVDIITGNTSAPWWNR